MLAESGHEAIVEEVLSSSVAPAETPHEHAISVVIPTYRRPELVRRLALSVVSQLRASDEIVGVDDGSPGGGGAARADLPRVRLVRQENAGVGPARNRGLAEATNPWALVVDDDDELLPAALELVRGEIPRWEEQAPYPVLTFASSNATLPGGDAALTFADYALGRFRGDLIPLIHRERFRAAGYSYPDTRVGGEHLLWYRIAADATIPASSSCIVRKHDDALERLTSAEAHLRHATAHAELQEETLAQFGAALRSLSAEAYGRRRLGAATFRLLSGDRRTAREQLALSGISPLDRRRVGLWVATLLPHALVARLFLRYRRRQWAGAARTRAGSGQRSGRASQ